MIDRGAENTREKKRGSGEIESVWGRMCVLKVRESFKRKFEERVLNLKFKGEF